VKTSEEVQHVLKLKDLERSYPLFTTINRIINGLVPVQSLLNYKEVRASAASLQNVLF